MNSFFLLVLTGITGLIIGSFLNVVVYRLPLMLQRQWHQEASDHLRLLTKKQHSPFNFLMPRSHCPHCKQTISAFLNIPLISYFLLKGKCAHCHQKISWRYPVLELMSLLLSVIVVWHYGNLTDQAIATLFFTWSLLVLNWIDIEEQLLPDIITLPLLWLGLLANTFHLFTTIEAAIYGAVAGYVSLWCIGWIFRRRTGKIGIGHGDFKLFALLGAWLGWQFLPFIILLASVSGSIISIILIMLNKQQRDKTIPFGPYLAVAGWLILLYGNNWLQNYW